MGEAARMPELGRNAIKGDLVLELLPPVLRNEAIPPAMRSTRQNHLLAPIKTAVVPF